MSSHRDAWQNHTYCSSTRYSNHLLDGIKWCSAYWSCQPLYGTVFLSLIRAPIKPDRPVELGSIRSRKWCRTGGKLWGKIEASFGDFNVTGKPCLYLSLEVHLNLFQTSMGCPSCRKYLKFHGGSQSFYRQSLLPSILLARGAYEVGSRWSDRIP